MAEPDFWGNQEKAQAISREVSLHKKITEQWSELNDQVEESCQF